MPMDVERFKNRKFTSNGSNSKTTIELDKQQNTVKKTQHV